MRAIILAAGKGTRLYPLTRDRPKSLIPLHGGQTILDIQLQAMAEAGIRDVTIVAGYLADQIEKKVDTINQRDGNMNLVVRYNPFYGITNNLVSLWFALRDIIDSQEVVIVNGDDLFRTRVLKSLTASRDGCDVLVTVSKKTTYDEDDMKVEMDGSEICRISKSLDGDVAAESVGMIRVGGAAKEHLARVLSLMIRHEPNHHLFWLDVFNEMISRGERLRPHEVGTRDWCEVDFHIDLATVRHRLDATVSWLDETGD